MQLRTIATVIPAAADAENNESCGVQHAVLQRIAYERLCSGSSGVAICFQNCGVFQIACEFLPLSSYASRDGGHALSARQSTRLC